MKIKQPLWVKAFASAFIVALVGALVACGGSNSSSGNTSPVYTAVIDAGSSGTRLSLYQVIPGNGAYPQATLIKTIKFSDNGINDFILGTGYIKTSKWTTGSGLPAGYNAPGCNINVSPVVGGTKVNGSGDSTSVGACVLQPLLDSISGNLTQLGLTPTQVKVELLATAGMRTVAFSNGGTKSDADIVTFYQTMKTYVSTTKGFAVGDFRTINGNSEEGVWTWVNMNDYYYNIFGGNPTVSAVVLAPVGDFEVGGSSMQIAFPTATATSDAGNVYPVKINGKSFNVYSKTFLGLGGDDSRKFMRSAGYTTGGAFTYDGGISCFASSANSTNTAEPSGISLFYNLSLFPSVSAPVNNPTLNASTSTWLTEILAGAFPMTWTTQVGAWNPTTCAARYTPITNDVIALPRNADGTTGNGNIASYSNLRNIITTSTAPFVGLDTFYYVAQGLGLTNPSGFSAFSASTLATQLNTTCSAPILPTPGNSDDYQTQGVCANGSYMNDFLFRATTGLFTSNGTAAFTGVLDGDNSSGATVLTWTRGYLMLKYAN